MTTNCSNRSVYGPPVQTIFLGASIKDFSIGMGWNEQASTLSVNLVVDDCASNKIYWNSDLSRSSGIISDPGFTEPDPGSPVLFRVESDPYADEGSRGGIEFGGIIQSWTKSFSQQGTELYNVQITDPRQILQNTQVIVGRYVGDTSVVPNVINAYAFAESQSRFSVNCDESPAGRFGGVTLDNDYTANERGMSWNDVKCAIQTLTTAPHTSSSYAGFLDGGRIKYVGGSDAGFGGIPSDGTEEDIQYTINNVSSTFSSYGVDLSEIPFAPSDYRISGPVISLMELITQVCNDAGCDFFIELLPSTSINIIKVRTVDRTNQPVLGKIQEFVDDRKTEFPDLNGGILDYTIGEENRAEDTSYMLIGGKERVAVETTSDFMFPYWGKDNDDNIIQATITNGQMFVRLDMRKLTSSLTSPFSSDYAWVSEAEILAALGGDVDTFMSVCIGMEGDLGSYLESNNHRSLYAIDRIKDAAEGTKPSFSTVSPKNGLDPDLNFSSTSSKDLSKLFEFIKTYADEYYGKQFIAQTDFICYVSEYEDALDGTKKKYSHEPSPEGCWVNPVTQPTILGLDSDSSESLVLRSEDGRWPCLFRFPYTTCSTYAGLGGSLQPDLSKLPEESFLTNGTYVWVKGDIQPEVVIGNPLNPSSLVAGVVIKLPAPVVSISSRTGSNSEGTDVNQAGADFFARDLDPSSTDGIPSPALYLDRSAFTSAMTPFGLAPDSAMIAMLSNVTVYGPWGEPGLSGPTRVEHDDSFVPWEFGSISYMDAAANEKINSALSYMRKGERGTLRVAGILNASLGSELGQTEQSNEYVESRNVSYSSCADDSLFSTVERGGLDGTNGPNITNINVTVGSQGFTTEYQFSTYTPRFGKFSKDNADRLRQIGQQRLALQRNSAAQNSLLRRFSDQLRQTQEFNSQFARSARAPKSANHMFIARSITDGDGERLDSFTMNAREAALTFPSDSVYSESAIMGVDGLLRPISRAGDGGLSPYMNKGTSTSGNSFLSIPPDGPRATYSGLSINQDYLDPVSNPGQNASARDVSGSGHSLEILGRNSAAPTGGWSVADTDYASDYRYFALRGPIMIQSWGYDVQGKPIPNASDTEESAQGGTFESADLSDNFLDKFLIKPSTWPVAPLDLRLDRNRGVWTVPPPPRNLHINITGCYDDMMQADVENPQIVYDADGNETETKIAIEESPWGVKIPSGIGKIPVYYDPFDTKYYPFPINKLDVVISGADEASTFRGNDIKNIVFGSGFELVDSSSGCYSTVTLSVSGLSSSGDKVYASQASWTGCLGLCTGVINRAPIENTVQLTNLIVGTGLILSNGYQLDSYNTISNIDYTCGEEPSDTGCIRFVGLKLGSGLDLQPSGCTPVINVNLPISGSTLDSCVSDGNAGSVLSENLATNALIFEGYLSTSFDDTDCSIRVSGVKPSITIGNYSECNNTGNILGRADTIRAGDGLEFVLSNCTGTLNTNFTIDSNFCTTNFSKSTVTGIHFEGLRVTDNGCKSVRVERVFDISGINECDSENTIGFHSSDVTGIVFRNMKLDGDTQCGKVTVESPFYVSGLNTCYINGTSAFNSTGVKYGTGLFIEQSAFETCSPEVHVRLYASGSKPFENDLYNRIDGFKTPFAAIEFIGGLSSVTGECGKITVSGIDSLTSASGWTDQCDQSNSTLLSNQLFSSIVFGTGFRTTAIDDGRNSAIHVNRAFHISGDGGIDNCRGQYYYSGPSASGLVFGEGLKAEGLVGCAPRITTNLFASGASEPGAGLSKLSFSDTIQVTGGLYVSQIDDCSILISGSNEGSISGIKIFQTGVCGAVDGSVSSVDAIAFGSGVKINQVNGSTGIVTLDMKIIGSPSECYTSLSSGPFSATGITFGTGLSTVYDTCGNVHVNSRFYVSGTDECGSIAQSAHISTGLVFGRGVQVQSQGDCMTLIESAIRASGSNITLPTRFYGIHFDGNLNVSELDDCSINVSGEALKIYQTGVCGKLNGITRRVEKIGYGSGISVDYQNNTTGIVLLDFRGQGSPDQCDPSSQSSYNITGITFGTGLSSVYNGCGDLHVNSRFYVSGAQDSCRGIDIAASHTTGLVFGRGIEVVDDTGCSLTIRSNIYASGNNQGTPLKENNWDAIEFTGNLSTIYDAASCKIIVSGSSEENSSLSIYQTGVCGAANGAENVVSKIAYGSGLSVDYRNGTTGIVKLDFKVAGDDSECFTSIANTFNTTGITFGTGLKVTYDDCGNVNVNSRFLISGDGDACRGTEYATAHTTGLVIGGGLKTTAGADGCSPILESNIFASGSQTLGGATQKISFNAIQFTGNLTVQDQGDGCTVLVSGTDTTIDSGIYVAHSGTCSTDAVSKQKITEILYATGLNLTVNGPTGIISSNISATGSRLPSECDVNTRSNAFDSVVEDFNFVGYLSSSLSGCQATISGTKSPITVGTTGTAGVGNESELMGIYVGTGLQLSSDGCSGIIQSNIKAAGSTYNDPCSVDTRSNQFSGKLFENISFGGYLNSSVSADGLTINVSGGKSPINMGSDGSLFESIALVAGSGITITQSGTCSGVIHSSVSTIAVTGSDSACIANTNVVNTMVEGITFRTGLLVTDNAGNMIVDSPFFVRGDEDGCRGTSVDPAHTTGISVGKGLLLSNSSCGSSISTNIYASGASAIGGAAAKIGGWDAIQFTGNLTVSSIDGCTIQVSGRDTTIESGLYFAQNQSCSTPAIAKTKLIEMQYGTGLSLTVDGTTGILNSNISAIGSEISDICDSSSRANNFDKLVEDFEFAGYLSSSLSGCKVTVSGVKSPITIGSTGTAGVGNESDVLSLYAGSGLQISSDGCSGIIQSNITAEGSTYSDPCSVDTRSNSFSNKLLENISFGGYLNSSVSSDGLTINVSGGKSPINMGSEGSTFESIGLIAGSGITIVQSGTCSGVIHSSVSSIAVTGSDNACVSNTNVVNSMVEGITFRSGLVTTDNNGNMIVDSPFFIGGDEDGCRGTSVAPSHATGITVGKGLLLSNSSCDSTISTNIYASGASTVGGALAKIGGWDAIQLTGNLTVSSVDGCTIQISGSDTITDSGIYFTKNATCSSDPISKQKLIEIQYGTGLALTIDGTTGILNSNISAIGSQFSDPCDVTTRSNNFDKHVEDFEFAGYLSSSISGCKVTVSGSKSPINMGTDGSLFESIALVAGSGIEIVSSGTCSGVINAIPNSISITGSDNLCTPNTSVVNNDIDGITFGTGLIISDNGGNVSVNSPFYVRSSGGCRSTTVAAAHATGITIGKGLELQNSNCDSRINLNISASGGPGSSKLTGWDAIEFTGNLSVSSIDDCTIRISGTPSTIAVTGSSDPCSVNSDVVVNSIDGIIFGSGMTTSSDGDTISVNSRFDGRQGAACGAGAGAFSNINKIEFGSGLSFTTDGCTGIVHSNISVDGSTYTDPCSVSTRSNAFTNQNFQNISFEGFLNTSIDGCDVTVSGGKSPINMGSDGSLFESMALVAGSGIEIVSSGTCSGVIHAVGNSIAVTGSDNPCTVNTNVVNNAINGITFGTGMVVSDTDGNISVNSPFFVRGDEDGCRGTSVDAAHATGISIGKGLLLSNSSCGSSISTNIYASGSSTLGGAVSKIGGWDAIQFTGNLSVSSVDGCTIQVSGTNTSIDSGVYVSHNGSCSSPSVPREKVIETIYGTGLQLTIDGTTGIINSNISVIGSELSDICNVYNRGTAVDSLFDEIEFGGYLSASKDDCKITISGTQSPITMMQSGVCGESNGSEFTAKSLVAGSGLTLISDGCSGLLKLDFTAEGNSDRNTSTFTTSKKIREIQFGTGLIVEDSECGVLQVHGGIEVTGSTFTDPCSVDTRSNSVNGVATNIDFGGFLTTTVNGTTTTVTAEKSPINLGSDGSLFESIALVAGSGITIVQSGTCSGVIHSSVSTLAVTGSNNLCTPNTNVVNTMAEGITFRSGLIVEDNAGNLIVDSPFFIRGDVDGCRGTDVDSSNVTGIIVGKGLLLSNSNCGSTISSNIYVSGASTLGGAAAKIGGWDAIQLTGSLTASSIDGCTIQISGTDTVNDSGIYFSQNAACSTASVPREKLIEMQYGTGLLLSIDGTTGTLVTNISAIGSEVGDVCDVNNRSNSFDERVEDFEFIGFLSSAVDGCKVTVSGTRSPIYAGEEGSVFDAAGILAGTGITISQEGCSGVINVDVASGIYFSHDGSCSSPSVSREKLIEITYGTGLQLSIDGTTGTLNSNISAIGSLIPDVCDVNTRGTASDSLFDEIEFAGYLSTSSDGCKTTVSGTQTPIDIAGGKALQIALGSGLEAVLSGDCGAVIHSSAVPIAITGSSDQCSVLDNVSINEANGIVFGSGIQVSANGGVATVSSPYFVEGAANCSTAAYSKSLSNTLIFGNGLKVTGYGDCGQKVESTISASGNGIDQTFEKIKFVGPALTTTSEDSCTLVVSGVGGAVTVSGIATCGDTQTEGFSTDSISFGTGLSVENSNGNAIIQSNIKVAGAGGDCASDVSPTVFQTLEFGTGLSLVEGEDCTWKVSSSLSVSGYDDCSYTTSINKNGIATINFGRGIVVEDDGTCAVRVSASKTIGGGGSNGCLGAVTSQAEFSALSVSGLGLVMDGCTGIISGPKIQIGFDGACGEDSIDPVTFSTLEVSTGLRLETVGCNTKLAGGMKFQKEGCGISNDVDDKYGATLVAGDSIHLYDQGGCSFKISAGLSGVRSGSNIRGQSVNCFGNSDVVMRGGCANGDGDNVPASRGIPENLQGIYTGPGIGATVTSGICENDTLVLYANNAVSGLGGTCGTVNLGLGVYTTKYSNAFAVGGTNGLDLTTSPTVDGSTFSHGTAVYLNEGGGSWVCSVVTGIEVTKNGSYVTDVTALFGQFGGSITCTAGDANGVGLPSEDRKFWLKQVPCVE